MPADRNLLLGILAVQMNFVGRDALIAAMNAWVLEKHRPLGEILQQHGALSTERAQLLDALVAEHLKVHDDDPHKSLAALSSVASLRQSLQQVVDDEVQRTVAMLNLSPESDGALPGPDLSAAAAQRFRVLRPHAKGGLGEVFVAEDLELHREVALKEIQFQHADNANSRGRFVLEAEVTGGLEHPNIVPVYGLGSYADGRPFYAMRFIKGDSLKDAIEQYYQTPFATDAARNLAFRNLLKRFVDVCNAVAYAHSRRVLHRDLKPGNIMLGKYGETLVVDWGLAKALGPSPQADPGDVREERTLQPASGSGHAETQMGAAHGTPAFMSPEQAAGRLDELGPATDVYSLGATLYVLLTRQPAFTGTLHEILVKVKAGDFQPPRQVRPGVPAALDAVVCRAMALQATRRYATPTVLAEEIERYLADEPVTAFREPWRARAARWARKHPGRVAAVAATVLVGVLGLGVGLVLVNAEKNRTERARQQAVRRFQLALDAFNDMVFGIQNKLEDRPGTQELRKDLLENARKGLRKLLKEAEHQGNPDSTLLWSHLRTGDVELLLGNTQAAHQEYQTGHELAQRLAQADPTSAEAQRALSLGYSRLGDVTLRLGQTREALGYYRQSLEVSRRLAQADPTSALAQRDLGVGYSRLGDVTLQSGQTQEALGSYRQSLEVSRRLAQADPTSALAQRDLGVGYSRLGDVTLQSGQAREALGYYRQFLEVSRRLAQADPTSAEAQRDLCLTYIRLGDVALQSGQTQEALGYSRQSLEVSQRLAQADPTSARAQTDLFFSHYKVGVAEMAAFAYPQAAQWLRQADANLTAFQKKGWFTKPEQMLGNWSFGQWQADVQRRLQLCDKAEPALADLAFALKQPAAEVPGLLDVRLRVFLHKKDRAALVATAEAFSRLAEKEPKQTYNAACAWSLASGLAKDDADLREDYAGKALVMLKQTPTGKDHPFATPAALAVHAHRDKDMDPLRERADFQAFLADLHAPPPPSAGK